MKGLEKMLSDCPKCWDTPCRCGHSYEFLSKKEKIELCANILGLDKRDFEKCVDSLLETNEKEKSR